MKKLFFTIASKNYPSGVGRKKSEYIIIQINENIQEGGKKMKREKYTTRDIKKIVRSMLFVILSGMILFGQSACGRETREETTTEEVTRRTRAAATTKAAETTVAATTIPSSPEFDDREIFESNFFSVAYTDKWIYEEDNSKAENTFAYAYFNIPDEQDSEKKLYRLEVRTAQIDVRDYRDHLHYYEFDLQDVADGKIETVEIAGLPFIPNKHHTAFIYRDVPSGITCKIYLKGVDIEGSEEVFAEIYEGLSFNLPDAGNQDFPWPWEGVPYESRMTETMVGSFTIVPEWIKISEPIVSWTNIDNQVVVQDDMVYVSCPDKKSITSYKLENAVMTQEDRITVEKEYELMTTDDTNKLYLSTGTGKIDVFEDMKKVMETNISHDVVMHKSGDWGITHWINTDPMKVSFKDGVMQEEAWVLANFGTDDHQGYFGNISSIGISDNHIMISGYAKDKTGDAIMVYDFDGNEVMLLTDANEKHPGYTVGIVETANGFMSAGFAGNLHFWTKEGTYIGKINASDLLGSQSVSPTNIQLLDDGSVMLAFIDTRADQSADELLIARLTGF